MQWKENRETYVDFLMYYLRLAACYEKERFDSDKWIDAKSCGKDD